MVVCVYVCSVVWCVCARVCVFEGGRGGGLCECVCEGGVEGGV